jgi:hypothetical protein
MATIHQLVNMGVHRISELTTRVEGLADSYSQFRFALLTEIKKEYINVPAKNDKEKRMAVFPWEYGDANRKKRNTGDENGAKKKKTRRKRKVKARKTALLEMTRKHPVATAATTGKRQRSEKNSPPVSGPKKMKRTIIKYEENK